MKLLLNNLQAEQQVYICDFRQPDLNKKPIRHIKPTAVHVVSNEHLPKNKTIYYWDKHFRPLNSKGTGYTSKIIAPFDNTGYRGFTGIPLNIFDNMEECVGYYIKQCDEVVERMTIKRDNAANVWQNEINNVYDYIYDVVGAEAIVTVDRDNPLE